MLKFYMNSQKINKNYNTFMIIKLYPQKQATK